MMIYIVLIALAKKKNIKFTPAPTPEPYYNSNNQQQQQYEAYRKVTTETFTNDDFDDLGVVGFIFILGFAIVVGICVCKGEKANGMNNSSNMSKHVIITNEPLNPLNNIKVTKTTEEVIFKPKVTKKQPTTISWSRYNEVANDTLNTINDYNSLLTKNRKMIKILQRNEIAPVFPSKNMNQFMKKSEMFHSVTEDVDVDTFNHLVHMNTVMTKRYNKLCDIANANEEKLLNNGIEF